MAPKIVIFAPDRPNCTVETVSAKVSVFVDRRQLAQMLDDRFTDLVILLDAPAEVRRQLLAAAKKAGQPAVALSADDGPAGSETVPTAESADPMETARRYMDGNFRRPLTLEKIAAHAGVSAGYFCRRFKVRFQTTPIMYLRQLRLTHATHLLLNTDLPLCDITDQSGFFSVSYFCREFHKLKGLAPITFRRRHKTEK